MGQVGDWHAYVISGLRGIDDVHSIHVDVKHSLSMPGFSLPARVGRD